MSNFIFKVPELPGSRRNVSNVGSFTGRPNVGDTSRLALTNGFNRELGTQLQNINEEDFVQPSTSAHCRGIVDCDKNSDMMRRLNFDVGIKNRNLIGSGFNSNKSGLLFNYSSREMGTRSRDCFKSMKQNPYNSLVSTYNPFQSCYQMNKPSFSVAAPEVRNSMGVRNGSFRDSLISTTLNIHNSLNPLYSSYQTSNKSLNLFHQPRSISDGLMDDTCSKLSSISNVNSVGYFQNESRLQRKNNMSVCSFMKSMSSRLNCLDSVNNTGQLHSTAILNESANENEIAVQLMISEMDSTQEQVMKVFEDLTHMLMRNSLVQDKEEMSYFEIRKATMKIRDIFYNSKVHIKSKISTTELRSIMDCTGDVIGQSHKRIVGYEKIMNKNNKKFQDILYSVGVCERKIEQPECFESFTVKRKKGNNIGKEKAINEDVNLSDWFVAASDKGLSLIGTNEENIRFKTATVEKRLNNRRLLLNNGRYCNLIGSPLEDKSLPSSLWKKIKDGIPRNWRWLIQEIIVSKAEKEKEDSTEEVTSTCQKPKRGPTAKGQQPSSGERSELASEKSNRQRKAANDTILTGKGCAAVLDEPTPRRLRPKGRTNCASPSTSLMVKGSSMNDTVVKTKSGRVVKQPKDLWIGQNFMNETIRAKGDNANATVLKAEKGNGTVLKVDKANSTVLEAGNKKTMVKAKSREGNTTKQMERDNVPRTSNRKRRVASEKAAVDAKKMKREKTKEQEEMKTTLKESKKLGKPANPQKPPIGLQNITSKNPEQERSSHTSEESPAAYVGSSNTKSTSSVFTFITKIGQILKTETYFQPDANLVVFMKFPTNVVKSA